ncbi:hypothetical protein GOP47_0019564 [Adiantum capillus-veneris]|uniref:Uncharacterized protein n=1 Tax=Adiantum capillus-veneris TaxID=13818 RepID=A0A9D4Z7X6_ADICA|nr:hypothetical protein GOP47_0019564 [Adiantum capillus-veneris]
MRVIGTKLLSAWRKPLVASRWGPYSVSQLCSEDVISLGKLNVLDCSKDLVDLGRLKTVDFIADDKADLPLNCLQSSNIFLKPQVVLYDGVCHLCNAGVNWVIKADKGKRGNFHRPLRLHLEWPSTCLFLTLYSVPYWNEIIAKYRQKKEF